MGLHLNYELRLPGTISRDEATALLIDLRAFATTQPFADVSPVLSSDRELSPNEMQRLESLQFFAKIIALPDRDAVPSLTGDANSAQGFLVNPGKGCETATFGLLRRADATGDNAEWFWHCSCKTQYASVVSDSHLIACHTSLVHVLDHAMECGMHVVVRDETAYWDTRDTSRLVQEVHTMNRIVAAFAGKLSDTMGPAHNLQAPIFEHREFEHLEMGDTD